VNHANLLYNLYRSLRINSIIRHEIIFWEGLVMMGNNTSVSKKPIVRTHIILLLAGILVLSAALTVLVAYHTGLIYGDFSKLATVNGEPVYVREYKMKLKSNTTQVIDYFNQNYGSESKQNFWTNSYNGEVPVELAREKALNDIIEVKVQQILAKENGIIESTDYRDFLKDLEDENRQRKDALKNNKIVYGPDNYGEFEYFKYSFDNMVLKLKEKLKEKELAIPEDRLEGMYSLLKETRFRLPDNIKIQTITISFADDKGIISDGLKNKARIRIEEAKKRIDSGEPFEKVASEYNAKGSVVELTFTKEKQMAKDVAYPELLTEAVELEPGQVSEVIERGTDFALILCKEKKSTGYLSYKDAKKELLDELVEKDYEEYIDRLVEEANVEINEKLYKRMNVR